jgi:outer membrane biosynthesis protein TonB
MRSTLLRMQGTDSGGLDDAIAEQERLKAEALHRLMEADAELDRLRENRRVRNMTPEQRRRAWRVIAGGAAGAVGAVVATALAVREKPVAAAASVAGATAITLSSLFTAPPLGDPGIGPDPPRVVGQAPKLDPPPGDLDAGDAPRSGPPTLEEVSDAPSSVGPSPSSGDGVTPEPVASTQPEPPAPDPLEPPPSQTPEPPPSPEPPDEPITTEPPEPSPTPTVAPPEPPQQPEAEPLLCLDVDLILEADACVDVPLLGGL